MRRREFLGGMGALAVGGAAAACGVGAPAPNASGSAPAATPFKTQIGFTSVSAANAGIWAAADGGYLRKYGLDATLINIADSTQAVAALLHGDTPINAGISGTAVVASAIQGSDLTFLAVTINVFPSSIYVKTSIASPADLKGKRIGVTRFGTASDAAGRAGLRGLGLKPADVTFLQTGGLNETLTALASGNIDAGVLSPPITVLARDQGFRELVDVATLGIQYVYNAIATSKTFAKQNPDAVLNTLRAVIEGTRRFQTDAEFGKKIIADRTKLTDAREVEETWRLFATRYLHEPPFMTDDGIKGALDDLVASTPKAAGATPSSFYDNTFMQKLQDEGFIAKIMGS